jgi:hypothetical protein
MSSLACTYVLFCQQSHPSFRERFPFFFKEFLRIFGAKFFHCSVQFTLAPLHPDLVPSLHRYEHAR